MIPEELLAKYGLPEDDVALAIEEAISYVLSRAFQMDVLARVGVGLEIVALAKSGIGSQDLEPIDMANISRQLRRQIRYQIERELEKRQSLREWDLLRSMRGRPVAGEVRKVSQNGDVTITLEVEEHFRSLILTGTCSARQIPPKERGFFQIGTKRTFFVTSVLPVREKDKSKVLIRLSRTSRALPESLLRETTGEASIRCRRRIAGAFSEIETSRRIPKEAIQAVGKELGERIIVRVVATEKKS